jgi:hypothetical protein
MKPALPLALVLALILGACADNSAPPPAPGAAVRFESGGGPTKEVALSGAMAAEIVGQWEGSYAPYDPVAGKVTGPPVGVTALVIHEVEDTLARGRIVWAADDGTRIPGRGWTAALTRTGHFMFLNSHAVMMEQNGVRFFEADIILDDGRSYLHRWLNTAG